MAHNYIQAPQPEVAAAAASTTAVYGMGLHQTFAAGFPLYAYVGLETSIFPVNLQTGTALGAVATGQSFATSPPSPYEFWWFTSHGDTVVATNYATAVKKQLTHGSGSMSALISSTFKPRARLAFSVRQNLFLAHCRVDTAYDSLVVGDHPWLVCWSMNDNIAAFGSREVDPQFIGAGYQQLGNDLGPITAGIGGDFGIVFQSGGITRIDGPPYEFRTIVVGDTTFFPYSVFRHGDDIFFWGAGGPSVLRGGEGPVERLVIDKLQRSLLDNLTGFGADFALNASLTARSISGGMDPVNDLLRWSFPPEEGVYLDGGVAGWPTSLFIDIAHRERRSAITPAATTNENEDPTQHTFLRYPPQEYAAKWGPFGGMVAVQAQPGDLVNDLVRYRLGAAAFTVPDMEFQTGFGKLDDNQATGIVRVRPIWTAGSGKSTAIAAGVSVSVHTKNKPYEDATTVGPFTVTDAAGWVGTPGSVIGSFHSVTVKFAGGGTFEPHEIHEIEGVEIEYFVGGAHGA